MTFNFPFLIQLAKFLLPLLARFFGLRAHCNQLSREFIERFFLAP
jgi:hypothetical protein